MATSSPLDLHTVLTESKRIINAHSRHFLALSVLFLLPLSFSITVYSTLQDLLIQSSTPHPKTLLSYTVTHLHQDPSDAITTKTLVLLFVFSLFVFTLSLFATGSVTYSVFHGFYGRPVKLISAIKSAFASFFKLLITFVFTVILVIGMLLLSGCVFVLVIKGIGFLGFQLELSSPYCIGFGVTISIVLLLILVYLQLNWSLMCVVVVVESSWGPEALKRSNFLMKGMKGVAFSSLLFFGLFGGILLWVSTVSGLKLGISSSEGWKSWAFVVQIVVTSTLLMLLFLYNVAANTVLYMYCKALHGELAWEIAEEFAREYVSLPFDDGKVPHVVSVVYP